MLRATFCRICNKRLSTRFMAPMRDFAKSWRLPAFENLRDILTRLNEANSNKLARAKFVNSPKANAESARSKVIWRWREGESLRRASDELASEEPLEIRVDNH